MSSHKPHGRLHVNHSTEKLYQLQRVLGLLTPTAGAIYPTLKELGKHGLITGEWKTGEKRRIKVCEITERGREVFGRAVEKHVNIISATRAVILKELEKLNVIQKIET